MLIQDEKGSLHNIEIRDANGIDWTLDYTDDKGNHLSSDFEWNEEDGFYCGKLEDIQYWKNDIAHFEYMEIISREEQ